MGSPRRRRARAQHHLLNRLVPTFSLVARDDSGAEWGVAVASKFLAVGSVVPWARADAGAVATQALANPAYGPDGLEMLARGSSAQEALDALVAADEGRDDRQLGIVDRKGDAATYTGKDCFSWAGGRTGPAFACQGNILTGADVIDAMSDTFLAASGTLEDRLITALAAGDAAGGDSRGRQSAALLVVREGGGYMGGSDVACDLRVDDHPQPVNELSRLLQIHRLLFPRPEELEFVPVDASLARELSRLLGRPEQDSYDEELRDALYAFVGRENLEERWRDGPEIERAVLDHLRAR